jgi:hypothetical protein
MTKPATVTQAQIERTIRAVRQSELCVKAVTISPGDGKVVVETTSDEDNTIVQQPSDESKWADD